MYWSPSAIPELQAIPEHARKSVWRQAFSQAQQERSGQKAVMAMLLIAAGVPAIAVLLVDWKPFNLGVTMASVFVAGLVYVHLIYNAAIPQIAKIFAEQYPQK